MKVMTIIGTRPEGIKMAPILRALDKDPSFESIFVNTGQHAELLDQVLELFDLKPNYDFKLMRPNQSLHTLSSRIINALSVVLEKERPDIVLVHGDTTTTFIASYCAFLSGIPVGHVEAGLRTNNLQSPFPEEANRQLASRIASFHFAATETNRLNLLNEGVSPEKIFVVGNSVIDALHMVSNQELPTNSPVLETFSQNKKTILLTTHRRENLSQLSNIYEAIHQIIDEHKDVQVVFPVHKNPHILQEASELLGSHPRIHLTEPFNYTEFAYAMKHAFFIITDSGGIQEEAPTFGTPVLVARDTTERYEGVEAGTLKLVGISKKSVYSEAKRILTDDFYRQSFSEAKNPYGDGKTSERIANILLTHPSLNFPKEDSDEYESERIIR